MSVPPELMAALQQAQGGNADAGFQAPDASQTAPPGQGGPPPGQTAENLLRHAIEFCQAAIQAEPDDQDSQELAQIIKQLYAIFSTRAKEGDQAMGGKVVPRQLRRGA
jgi:hypothetical protein